MKSLLRSYSAPWLITAMAVLFLHGCYYFVSDDTPPEWDGPATAAEQAGATAAGAGGPGATVYNTKCASCHQSNGKGLPGVYPPLGGSSFATGDPAIPIRIVLHGFHGPIERNGKQFNGVMQPWGNELSDQQIADVLTHVRTSFGNNASAIEPAMVTKIREATAGKSGAYTEDELKTAI